MNNVGKKLEIFVIVSIIAFIGIIYAFKQQPAVAPASELGQNENSQVSETPTTPYNGLSVKPEINTPAPSPSQQVPSTTITYQGVDGKNALELLKANHLVEVKHYDFGDLVTSIDGISPDSHHFWGLYVNDQFSQVGASSLMTKSTDNIKWEIDTLEDITE